MGSACLWATLAAWPDTPWRRAGQLVTRGSLKAFHRVHLLLFREVSLNCYGRRIVRTLDLSMQPEDYLPNDLVPMVAAAPYFLRAANIRYPLRAKEHTALGVCEAVWGRDFRWLLGQMNEAENRSLFRVAPEFGPALFMALKSTAERLHTEENERLRRNERVRRQKIADAKKTRRIMAGRCKSRENVEKPEVAFILPKEAVDPDEQIL